MAPWVNKNKVQSNYCVLKVIFNLLYLKNYLWYMTKSIFKEFLKRICFCTRVCCVCVCWRSVSPFQDFLPLLLTCLLMFSEFATLPRTPRGKSYHVDYWYRCQMWVRCLILLSEWLLQSQTLFLCSTPRMGTHQLSLCWFVESMTKRPKKQNTNSWILHDCQ